MLENLKTKIMFGCCGIVIFMMLVVIFSDGKEIKKSEIVVDKNEIMSIYDKTNENYTLHIKENINNNITNYIFYKDSTMEFYEKENDNTSYIKYKDNLYSINIDDYKINKMNDDLKFVNNEYYNLEFIRKIIDKCDFKYINRARVNCKVKRSDYYQEYNKLYNTNYGNDNDSEIDIMISYFNLINEIEINYSLESDIKIYTLKLKDVGSTDFTEIRNYLDSLNL